MPAYQICLRNSSSGRLELKYDLSCMDDTRARSIGCALVLRKRRRLEIWKDDQLIFARPRREVASRRSERRRQPRVA